MKKILTLLFMPLLCATALKAQTNLSFESWTSSGNYDNPDDWVTINALASLTGANPACRKAGAHWGNFGLKLNSCYISLVGDTIPGFAAQQFASHTRYKSFSFYYQYTGLSTSQAFVDVSCYKDSVRNNTPIGIGTQILEPHSSWNYVNVDIDWTTNEDPDTIMITIFTDVDYKMDTIIIDDIQLSQFTTSIASVSAARPELFVNSQRQIVLRPAPSSDAVNLSLYNALGQVVLVQKVSSNAIETSSLPSGIYVYRCISGGKAYTGKLILE